MMMEYKAFDREIDEEPVLDYAEIYRENYEDALDMIRDLKDQIKELKTENELLKNAV